MLRLKTVLVPTDHSRCAEQALAQAADFARRSGAILHLLHVDTPPGAQHDDPDLLQQLRTTPAGEGVTIVEEQRRAFKAGPAILEHAAEIDADLIVLGTHERGALAASLVGRVAVDVVRHAECPVITVRESVQPRHLATMTDLLVPVDFSDFCRRAVRKAAILARQEQLNLHLLHVVDLPVHPSFYAAGVDAAFVVDPDLPVRCRDQLAALAVAEAPDVPAALHVLEGNPARIICDFAAEHGSDLVFIATHGLTGFRRFFLGSVTEKVVRHAPCPVFVIKAFGKSLLAVGEEARA